VTGLLERDILVISQRAKLIEMTNEYRILDPAGEEVGEIREESQSRSKKLLRFVGDVDQFLTHRLSVYEAGPARNCSRSSGPRRSSSPSCRSAMRAELTAERSSRRTSSARSSSRSAEAEANGSGRSTRRTGARGISRSTTPTGWRSRASRRSGPGSCAKASRQPIITSSRSPARRAPDLRFLLVASAAALDTALKQDDSGGWGFGGIDLTDLIP